MTLTLVSGASGFVGQGLVSRLQSLGGSSAVAQFTEDVTDSSAFAAFLETLSESPTSYFHFAGISSIGGCLKDPARCEAVNTVAPGMLASILWRKFPKCLFVFPSTAAVYAPSEGAIGEAAPTAPESLYAHSKLNAEKNLIEAAKSGGHSLLILRLFNHSHRSQPPNFFLPSVFQQIENGRAQGNSRIQLSVGNIDIERDFGALTDLLSALQKIAEQPKLVNGITLANVASGQPKNLRQLIMALAQALGVTVDIQVDPQKVRAGEPKRVVGDSTKLQRLLQWTPVDGQSIDSFVQSFLKN